MPLKSQSEELPVLNLTSMIDVLFLLIIFFMVGTKFIESEKQFDLKVPQITPGTSLSEAPEKKVVNVYRDGEITLDRKTVSLEELTERLAKAREQYRALGVSVRGDGASAFELVANVLAACKRAGIADLSISVDVAGNENSHARR